MPHRCPPDIELQRLQGWDKIDVGQLLGVLLNSMDRLNCQVRLLDAAGVPQGCGFICGPRTVMTCTHVIESCITLGMEPVVECSFPAAPEHRASMKIHKTHPVGNETDVLRDLTVLELEEGSTFPPESTVVTSTISVLGEHMEFTGVGVREGHPEGVQISGKSGEYADRSRVFVASWHGDQAVKPGCSGAAIFHSQDGLVGMVAEAQQASTGLIVPIQIIGQVWPIRRAAAGLPPPIGRAAGMQAREPLNRRMLRRFLTFDREPQTADFRRFFDERWNDRRSALICTIGGIEADLPNHCRDKLRKHDLVAFLSRSQISSAKIDALEISWPHDQRRFDPDRLFARMSGELAVHIGAEGTDAEDIRAALREGLRPLIFYSSIDQRTFGKNHLELLRRWAAFGAEIASQPLERPLIHFLIVQLDPSRFRPDDRQPNAALARFYEDMVRDANRGRGAEADIRSISLLRSFSYDFIDTWLGNHAEELGLESDEMELVRENAAEAFRDSRFIRLQDVEAWMRRAAT